MNLYQECLNYMNGKSNSIEKVLGYYSLGKLKVNDWEVIIEVDAEGETKDRDVIVTPILLVPQYKNGQKTNNIHEELELNSNAEYIFWQVKERDKVMFSKVKHKINADKELRRVPFIEKTGATNNLFNDSVNYWLKNYSELLGYDFQAILDELKNDFEIETDF